ncbi:transposable element Tc1 transposase [Trichonephila clavipes]|nr:transposable element Tc1 transposase [Trichonephila clavipes]
MISKAVTELGQQIRTEEGLEPKRPSFFQSTPNNTYAIPWKSSCPEYRPVRFYIQPEEVLKELDEFQLFSPVCSALCVDEDAHPPTPFSGIPPAKASPASFHRELVAQLHEKLRSSPDMGNRGSSSSNAPSPDKKPSGTGQSGKSSKETPKSVKTENKNAKGSKIQNSSEKIPCRSPPKDLLLGSESGDSLVSSCSQNSNRNGVGRVDSTPSPDTSSMSSSLFVDVQEKEDFGKRNMPGKCARRHFLELSEFQRGLIIGMKTAGWSTRRVAGQVDCSECAVRNCWEQWTREGTHARKTGSGATRKTTRREDRRIVRQAVVDPTVTRSTIRADVGVAIVPQTISRHLAKTNIKSKLPFRALPLTPEHRQLRLQWCQARSMWNVTG